MKAQVPEVRQPAFCAPPAPDARRPLAATPAQPRPLASLAYDRRCAGSHRHGKVDIIFNMSELLHSDGLAQGASPTRPLRGNQQVKSAPAPPASAMSAQRACRASALIPPDCCRPLPCASHGRPSLLRPTPPPRSRRHGHPRRVRRHDAHRRRVRRGRRHRVLCRRVQHLHGPVLVVLVLLAVALFFVIARRSPSRSASSGRAAAGWAGALLCARRTGGALFRACVPARAGQGARQWGGGCDMCAHHVVRTLL